MAVDFPPFASPLFAASLAPQWDRPVPPPLINPVSQAANTSSATAAPAPNPATGDATSIMAMSSKDGQRRLNKVREDAKNQGKSPLSKADARRQAKELGRKERGETPPADDKPDSAGAEFTSLAGTAVHAASSVIHAVGHAADATGNFISGHAQQIGVPVGVAVVLGGTAAVAVDVAGGLGALAALF